MKQLDKYISEKLIINKDSELEPISDDIPKKGDTVLLVNLAKHTSREMYISLEVATVKESTSDYIRVNDVDFDYEVRDLKKISNASADQLFIGYFKKNGFDFWSRLYKKEIGFKAIGDSIKNYNRGILYVFGALKLLKPGSKDVKLNYLKQIRNQLI